MALAKSTRYVFKVIPHRQQRYETLGDWIPGRPASMIASKLHNPKYEFLVLFHEMIEHELCKKAGIKDRTVVAFDKKFERERKSGLHSPTAEPGASPRSPYRKQHLFATRLERQMAKQLGVDWNEYDAAVLGVPKKKKH